MERFGPLYCETPETITGIFPVEPANAISSGVIVLFGIAALFLVMRREPRSTTLYVACALLMLNGAGSILWHGLRTRWALVLDFLPALIFLLIVAFLWARRVAPLWQAMTAIVAVIAAPALLRLLDLDMAPPVRLGTAALAIVVLALWLIWRSYAASAAAALTGGGALLAAIAALTFRSVDAMACGTVPMGTHFMWHILLSTAAFLCMLTVVTLGTKQTNGVPASPRPQEG